MTEIDLRAQMCAVANQWLGCHESDGSHKGIIDIYNTITPLPRGYKMTYQDPWCAAFVSAVAKKCDLTDVVFPECACDPMINKYKQAGCWVENDNYLPKAGDLIFYDWQDTGVGDNTGSSDHVGLVTSVTGNVITVIEGNYSDSVKVRKVVQNATNIRGYAVPNYSKHINTNNDLFTISLKPIKYGDTGLRVKAVQTLLIMHNYKCGYWGADGSFGPATQAAVSSFQISKSIDEEGLVGPKTMLALLGG